MTTPALPLDGSRTTWFLLIVLLIAASISNLGKASAAAAAGNSKWSSSSPTVGGVVVSLAAVDEEHSKKNANNQLNILWRLVARGGSARTTKRAKAAGEKEPESSPNAPQPLPTKTPSPPRRLWLRSSQKPSTDAEESPPPKVDDDTAKPEDKEEKKAWGGMFGRKQDDQNATSSSSRSTKQRRKGGVEVLQLKSNKKEKETKTDKTPKTYQTSPPPSQPAAPATSDKKTTASPPSSTTTTNSTVDSSPSSESLSTTSNTSSGTTTTQEAPIIILGAPGGTGGGASPYRILRPGTSSSSPGGAGIMIPTGGPGSPGGVGGGRPISPNTVILAEVLANLLGTALRLWFITFVTRRLATQEETIHHVQHFVWERLNDVYVRDVAALQTMVQEPPLGVGRWWWKCRHESQQGPYQAPKRDLSKTFTRTVVVFTVQSNDKGALDLEFLASVVTFLLTQHRAHAFGTRPVPPPPPGYNNNRRKRQAYTNDNDDDNDAQQWPPPPSPMDLEVVMLVQSPGGAVTTYGLAAAQVRRLAQEAGISVTVCVDKYAASGGYMIASQAHKLIAAPFATIGSVGVIMEGLNFYELARRYGIQPVILKAGESKNPFSLYGPISKQDERIEKERLEKVHQAFKELIVEGRPALATRLGTVADGSIFLGQEALDVDLVDQVQTSDEYILERIQAGDRVLKLHKSMQPRLSRRFLSPYISPSDLLPHLRSWISDQVRLLIGGGDDVVAEGHKSSSPAEIGGFVSSRRAGTKSNTGLILALTGLWSIAQFWLQRTNNMPVQ